MAPKTFSGARHFKYGMPLYGIGWPEGNVFYLCGGGDNGIKNRLVFAESKFGCVTDQIGEHLFGDDCPMRMVVAPSGKSIVVAMTKGGIQRLDLDLKVKVPKVVVMSGDLLERMAAITGDVRCLAFSASGDQLALGCSDGVLQVYEWPAMKLRMDLSGDKKLPDSIRDVDFGLWQDPVPAGDATPGRSARVLSAVLENGSCEIWEWDKATRFCRIAHRKANKGDRALSVIGPDRTIVSPLPKAMEGAQIVRLRFSRAPGATGFHALTNSPRGSYISHWTPSEPPSSTAAIKGATPTSSQDTGGASKGVVKGTPPGLPSLPMLRSHVGVDKDAGTCFESSKDGSLLAMGTSGGSAVVVTTDDMKLKRKLLKAHMVFTTGVVFSPDNKHLLSISADASVQSTKIEGPRFKQGTIFHKIFCLTIIFLALVLTCLNQYLAYQKSMGVDLHAHRQEVVKWVGDALGFHDWGVLHTYNITRDPLTGRVLHAHIVDEL